MLLSYHNLKIKSFGRGLKLVVKSDQIYKRREIIRGKLKKCAEGTKEREENILRSYRHLKDKVYNIAYSNDFEHFITFTVSSEMANRYSYYECGTLIYKELRRFKRKYKQFEYVMVPEQHEDGAWHYHALFKGIPKEEFRNSGKRDKEGRTIYNVIHVAEKVGHTTATRVGDRGKAAGYLVKYITKDMVKNDYVRNRRKYWASRGADKTEIVRDYVENWPDYLKNLLNENDLISQTTSEVNNERFTNKLSYWLLAQP